MDLTDLILLNTREDSVFLNLIKYLSITQNSSKLLSNSETNVETYIPNYSFKEIQNFYEGKLFTDAKRNEELYICVSKNTEK